MKEFRKRFKNDQEVATYNPIPLSSDINEADNE